MIPITYNFRKLVNIRPPIDSIRSLREVGVLLRYFPQCSLLWGNIYKPVEKISRAVGAHYYAPDGAVLHLIVDLDIKVISGHNPRSNIF